MKSIENYLQHTIDRLSIVGHNIVIELTKEHRGTHMTEHTEDKLKDIGEITDELLNQLEEEFEGLLRNIEDYSIAKDGATLKDINSRFKVVKEVAKELNTNAKAYRKFIIDEAKEHGIEAQKEM